MAIAAEVLPEALSKALERPRGARFWRVALQVNPFEYLGRHAKPAGFADEAAYNAAIVEACREQGVEAIAITDHFRIDSSQTLASAAREAGIVVFPAFEAVTKEGVHWLCIFDPGRSAKEVERIIGECGVRDVHAASPVGDIDAEELLGKAREWDAIVVAAHVTSNQGGLLKKLSGQARVRLWRSPNLQAIAIPGPIEALPQDLRVIVQCEGDYQREYPIAVINARDVCAPEDFSQSSSWSWIKMTEITIDGLRQAVLDPDSRVRLATEPVPEEHTEFVALAWQSGFLDGVAIHFSENLNVFIGGRGTGKSTVVESLRYVLGLEPLGDEARRLHDGIVKNVLQSGTKISLLACTRRPGENWYVIERTVPNPPIVRDASGDVVDVLPLDVLRGTEIFGQHEISELTKSPERLTRLLDRFVEPDDSLSARKNSIHRQLAKTRRQIIEVLSDLAAVEDRLLSLPMLEDTLKRYRAAGVEERLRDQSLLVREEQVLITAVDRLAAAREAIDAFSREATVDTAFVTERALEELPAKDVLSSLEPAFRHVNQAVADAATTLRNDLAELERKIDSVKANWRIRQAEVTTAYEKILRDLQEEHVDGDEFIRLQRRIEELRPLRERKQLVRRNLEELEQRRRNLLAEWDDVRTAEYQQLHRAAKKVTKALERRLRVNVRMSGDREPLTALLRKRIGGRLSEAIDLLSAMPDLSPRDLAISGRAGREELIKKYKLPAAMAERLAAAGPEVLMEIEELDLLPTTLIELNVAPEGSRAQWQPLDDLSTGQKATAVLLLLLHESSAPLVVDQPEDDLDNRFITEGVVPRMRQEKQRRQFVFSTHNANIPVLGDAELILGLQASGEGGEHGRAEIPDEHVGSIDSEPVRELVEEILEGGREAFETRRRKYGF
ncbi:MAG TPA: AAA family ATPase [Gaiellaceae bacterium]|nr:AAA family ATPase [Gaiellaceae bacterium]